MDERRADRSEPRNGRLPAVGRVYRSILRLLPPAVWREDGEEMAGAFVDLWKGAPNLAARLDLAVRAFGNLPWVAVVEWMEHLGVIGASRSGSSLGRFGMGPGGHHLRLAVRSLRKAPTFTLAVVLLLGLGVGAVTTIFTVVDHVVLRPLPYPSADRLFVVENGSHSGPMVREFQTMRSVDAWGFVYPKTANLTGEGDPFRLEEAYVSREFFSILGARPTVGRLLVDEDFSAHDAAVLSYGLWSRAFGRDPGVVGRTVRLDGTPVTVVGVLSEDFLPPEVLFYGEHAGDVWLPLDLNREEFGRVGFHAVEAMGRMTPGVTLADVESELGQVMDRLSRQYPDHFLEEDGTLATEISPAGLQEITTRPVRAGLGLLLGAVALLLLVACMNVAHLFLARGLGRVREMAVRRALGAGTATLVRQLLLEGLLVGAMGGLLGIGLSLAGLRTFLALNPSSLPRSVDLSLDTRVLLFASGVSLVTVLIFGLLPALRSVGGDVSLDMKDASRSATGGRGSSRWRNVLVVAEVAMSLVLVAGAGLLLKSFMRVQARDPGFAVEGVWTLPLTPSWISSPAEYVEAMDRVEASLATVPGVTGATYSLTLPLEMTGGGRCCWMTSSMWENGREHEGIRLLLQPVSDSYFETLGIGLPAGRSWMTSESRQEPWPVVISERLAVEIFGSAEGALNQTIGVGRERTPVQVMGVAEDTRHFGLDEDPPLFIYLPMEQLPFDIPLAHMAVRIREGAPAGWARTLREAVWQAVPDMPVPMVRSMEEWLELSTAGRRFDSVLFGAFGAMALILAAVGLYGTLLYNVGQRRREVGIRMALGAARRSVEGDVVRQGLLLAAAGCVSGLGGAWAVGRLLESRLFELRGSDPPTLALAAAVLLASALVASWLPARRAARIDPMEVLREE